MWPGYDCNVKLCNDGLFFNPDCATKFVSTTTILETINGMLAEGWKKSEIEFKYTSSEPDNQRTVVITKYNTRSYQIDDVVFSLTPVTHIFEWSQYDKETNKKVHYKTSLAEYMRIKYPELIAKYKIIAT